MHQLGPTRDRCRILKADLGVGYEELESQVLNQARLNTLEFLKKQATASLSIKQISQRERWNKKACELDVSPGQKVHIRPGRGQSNVQAKKAKLNWEGPYTVIELRPRANLLVQKDRPANSPP